MWQLSWMLSFLPEWFWTFLFFSSVIAIGLSFLWKLYAFPLKIGGAICLLISIWFLGAASNEEKWQHRIAELEAKLKVSEEKSQEINTQIVEKVVTKTKLLQSKAEKIVEYIDREVVKDKEVIKYIETCPIPATLIDLHNSAATMNRSIEGDKK